jgi:hypothetical protein
MSSSLLRNGGFEAAWAEKKSHRCLIVTSDKTSSEKDVGNIFTPPHWLTWFRHEPGTWDQPEVRDAWKNMDQRRVHDGDKGVLLFTFHRKHDAGFLQQVSVEPGAQLRFTAWAHAWSNHPIEGYEDCADKSPCSAGVGTGPVFLSADDVPALTGNPWTDAIGNFAFMVGIDPTGGTNPLADNVVWGAAAHIYNEYHQVPSVEATAQSDTVTVFLRSRTLWGFKHNDAYWDSAELVAAKHAPASGPPDGTSKMGIHVLQADRAGEFLKAGPVLAKFAGDWAGATEVPSGTLIIGSKPANYDVQENAGLPPRRAAEQFVSGLRRFFEAHPAIEYWEGPSNPICTDEESIAWYTEFEMARIELMAHLGLKCVIGNFATGTPPLDLWPAFLPAIETGLEHQAILGLHEYSCPWMWWLTGTHQPDPDDDQEDEGWATLRYRKVYRQYLLPNRLQIPLIITECGIDPLVNPKPIGAPAATWKELGEYWEAHDGEADEADYYFRQLVWYDRELCKDEYVIGMAPFTWGNWDGTWKEFDVAGTPVAEKMIRYIGEHAPGSSKPFVYANYSGSSSLPSCEFVPPREPYRRTYVLLPPIEDTLDRLEWRTAGAIGSSVRMRTLGHSIADAGVGPQDREVLAVNPALWGADIKAWYDEHHPGVRFDTVETDSPWELAIKLLPPLDEDIALAQTDPRWADYDFGEHPDTDTETIGHYGCFMTGLAIILRKLYKRDVTPPILDKLLVAARAAYAEDNLLMWDGVVSLFPTFVEGIKDDRQRSAGELDDLLKDGWEVILRRADGGHFVYLESVQGSVLHIIDTWDGERKQKAASHYQGVRATRIGDPVPTFNMGQQPSTRDASPWARPREPYKRTYVLLPQIEDTVRCLEWRVAAAIGTSTQIGVSDQMWTIGHSADDAGVGPQDRVILAVNPAEWGDDLEGWFDEHYPNAKYKALESESPWEMGIKLMPILDEDIALAQTDPRWADYDFGEDPDVDSDTIGRYGCFVADLAIILRKVYQRAVTPPLLDKLLVSARAPYVDDNLLMWEGVTPLFPAFDDSIKDNRRRSARELRQLLRAGWEVILRRADGAHFVYLEDVEGDVLHIIDTWDGKRKQKSAADYAGIRATHVRARGYPLPAEVSVGLHDEAGGKWMVEHELKGCCLVHGIVQRQPVHLDFRHLQEAGITVICRLNWGYADGTGTLPRPRDKGGFVDAVVKTMLDATGVAYFHVGNEPNNRSEWPGYKTSSEYALTAGYVTTIYNEIWKRVAGRAKLGPPPLDPYFGPHSSNRDWWQYILDNITGADALFLHAKTQTNTPNEIWSRMRFGNEPLTWQYLHMRTVETALAILPDRFKSLPVYVTELNPQHVKEIKGTLGWQPGNTEWVYEAMDYFRGEQPVTGVAFYRYEAAGDQAGFGLEDKPAILAAIEQEANA